MKTIQTAIAAALMFPVAACGDANPRSVIPVAPSTAASASASPPTASVSASQWSGTINFSSASPAGSCEAAYLESHAELFAQTASAELQIADTATTMNLQTSGGQQCVFSGTSASDTITLAARHETCDGFPLSVSVIRGIMEACHTIDPLGDGPFWGQGKLLARVASPEIDGSWSFDVLDPGGRRPDGAIVVQPTAFNVELHVHLAR